MTGPAIGKPGVTVRVEAPAKVNLYLRIVGRRTDGYHLLDSLVVFPAIGDTVEVEPADGAEAPDPPTDVIARRQSRRSNPVEVRGEVLLDRHAALRRAMTLLYFWCVNVPQAASRLL